MFLLVLWHTFIAASSSKSCTRSCAKRMSTFSKGLRALAPLNGTMSRLDAVCRTMGPTLNVRGVAQQDMGARVLDGGDVYQLGVGRYATGLRQMYEIFRGTGGRIYGFDTFAGIPPEEAGVQNIEAFKAGSFKPAKTVRLQA
jgi:hypothetical protein